MIIQQILKQSKKHCCDSVLIESHISFTIISSYLIPPAYQMFIEQRYL
jgi:hypothetical protein